MNIPRYQKATVTVEIQDKKYNTILIINTFSSDSAFSLYTKTGFYFKTVKNAAQKTFKFQVLKLSF